MVKVFAIANALERTLFKKCFAVCPVCVVSLLCAVHRIKIMVRKWTATAMDLVICTEKKHKYMPNAVARNNDTILQGGRMQFERKRSFKFVTEMLCMYDKPINAIFIKIPF